MSFLYSYIFKRSFQQEPVIQHAGFPSEVDSGESENTPVCQEQSGLPATVGVSCLHCFTPSLCLPEELPHSNTSCSWSVTSVVSLLFLYLQPGGAAGQRPTDRLLPTLP